MGDYSTFLFARPSVVEGASRLMDFAGVLNQYNRTATGEMADLRALGADWNAVGADIKAAIDSCRKELESEESASR